MKLLYFSAPWCGPCRVLGPIVDEVSQQIPIQKVDVDKEQDLSTQYGIRNIPTIIKVDNQGVEIKRVLGMQNKNQIMDLYNG